MIKPYYDEGGITIYHGDCREILPSLEPAGLVVMDPPYGIAYASNHGASWSGSEIANDSDTALRDWIVSSVQAPMIIFGTWKCSRPANTKQVLIWDKGPAFGMGDLSFPWKNSFEEIYILGEGFRGARDPGVIRGHVMVSWESKGRQHPNQKPVSLIRYLLSKAPAGVVVDPCMGSGTTLRAAKDIGRRAIGIEIDEHYCEVAATRMRQCVLNLDPAGFDEPFPLPEQALL